MRGYAITIHLDLIHHKGFLNHPTLHISIKTERNRLIYFILFHFKKENNRIDWVGQLLHDRIDWISLFVKMIDWVDRYSWFSRLNGFTLVMVGSIYSLLFGVSQSSVLKTVLWTIMVYFYKLWLGWGVFSLALIPHLFISIECKWLQISITVDCRPTVLQLYSIDQDRLHNG